VTEPTPDQAVLSTAQALTSALEGMSGQLAAVNKRQDRQRHVIIGLAVSLLIDVLLTVIVAVFAVTAHDASEASRQNGATLAQLHASEVASCQGGNQTRSKEIALWEHLYSLGVNSSTPPKVRREDNELIAYVKGVFAPRNCKNLFKLPGGTS
jgi:hypothetical protein